MIFMLLFNECSLLLHFEQLAAGPKNTHKFQSRRNYLYFGGQGVYFIIVLWADYLEESAQVSVDSLGPI